VSKIRRQGETERSERGREIGERERSGTGKERYLYRRRRTTTAAVSPVKEEGLLAGKGIPDLFFFLFNLAGSRHYSDL